jgi:type IV pilus assembly protein PilM
MTPELQKVINEINDQIVDEFKNTVTYFSQTQPEGIETSPLGYLFMTGGGAGIPGLDAALAAATQVPVHMINPFQRIKVNEKKFPLATIMPQAPLLAIATGLGMRRKSDNKK